VTIVEKLLTDDARNTIERICIDLLTRFYFGLDTLSYDEAIKTFASNATWIRFGERLMGAPAIRKKMDERPANVVVRHVLSNLHFTSISADKAHTRGYVTVYAHPFEGELKEPVPITPAALLLLDTDYALTPEGWRIQHHDGIFVMLRQNERPA
jgi:hypothetical protein